MRENFVFRKTKTFKSDGGRGAELRLIQLMMEVDDLQICEIFHSEGQAQLQLSEQEPKLSLEI